MADIASWQQVIEPVNDAFDPNSPATDLYEGCLDLLIRLARSQTQACHTVIIPRLRAEVQRFSLWGASFNAREGGLDCRIAEIDRLRNTLLPLLSGMSGSIVAICRQMRKEEEFWDACSRLQFLASEVEEARSKRNASEDEDLDISLDDLDFSQSDDSSSDGLTELEDLLRDVKSYNDCLYGLISVLETPAEDMFKDSTVLQTQLKSSTSMSNSAAWPFISSVIDVYPSIDREFARRLGEANRKRYSRLQRQRDRSEIISVESEDIGEQSGFAESTVPSTKLSSVFDDHNKHYQATKTPRPTASVTPFASSVIDGSSRRHNRGLPKMPEDQPWGQPFKCTICGQILSRVWSSAQWV